MNSINLLIFLFNIKAVAYVYLYKSLKLHLYYTLANIPQYITKLIFMAPKTKVSANPHLGDREDKSLM